MKITLAEIPSANSGKTLIIDIPSDGARRALLKRCEELEWVWLGGGKPTKPEMDFMFFQLRLGTFEHGKITWESRTKAKSYEDVKNGLGTNLILDIDLPSQIQLSKSKCLLCGSSGDDLFFEFYCSNPSCRNFRR